VQLITTLGLLIAAAAILAVVFQKIKQSSIIAFITVGIVAGLFREHLHLPHELTHAFTEIGIILLLFMAGLEVEFESFLKRWKLVIGYGVGQILLTALFGAVLGAVFLGTESIARLVFFGLCLTFSSTVIVIGFLKTRREMESLHGQIILGLMVLQDVTAVGAIVVLGSMGGEGSLVASLAILFAKLLGLVLLLAALAKWVLPRLFRHLARSSDLLFVGSLGWALGVAGLCELVHFSPEIGAFVAGGALSFLPYKLEIQDKVEPMKDFGVILFFLSLGYELKIGPDAVSLLVPIIAIAVFTVLGTPLLMIAFGYISRLNSRPVFMVGVTINQISEFSLILATMCKAAGLFDENVFLLVTLSALATIILSSFGHQFTGQIYGLCGKFLGFLDDRANRGPGPDGFELEDHVVVIKYNELAERVVAFFRGHGQRVLVIDIDPDVVDALNHDGDPGLRCMYLDVFDPDTWDMARFNHASAVISCLVAGQKAELAILRWLSEHEAEVPFVAATDSRREALELYQAGSTFVIQTEDLAAERLAVILEEYGNDLPALGALGAEHCQKVGSMLETGSAIG
jgi:Kef-type K+ transport system membrane component KefB